MKVFYRTWCDPRSRRTWRAAAAAITWMICAGGQVTISLAAHPVVRSLGTIPDHPRDELNRPRFRDRQSHYGWEYRGDVHVVVATTNREDAQWVAQQVDQTWAKFGKFADHWTSVHRHPEFAVGAIGVLIDDRPIRDRDAPLATMRVTSDVTMIYLNVAPGAPPLHQQLPRLKEATVEAFLHVTELDRKLPGWMQRGLAAYAAEEGEDPTQTSSVESISLPAVPSRQVVKRRVTPDRLSKTKTKIPQNREQAVTWVRYLLEGDDAQHAPALLAALRETAALEPEEPQAARAANWERTAQILHRPEGSTPVDRMLRSGSLDRRIVDWLQDRDVDQPVWKAEEGAEEKLVARQREMLVLLKLARRFSARPYQAIQAKVIGWGPEGMVDLSQQPSVTRPLDLNRLYEQLTDPAADPWATRDVDGSLLLSSNHERLRQLFGIGREQYRAQWKDGRSVLIFPWSEQHTLQGWLEDNPENPRRPLAKFRLQQRL